MWMNPRLEFQVVERENTERLGTPAIALVKALRARERDAPWRAQ